MKAESLKVLQGIVTKGEFSCEDKEFYKFLKDELARVVRIETPTTNSKFDLFKYVYKKDLLRPIMTGIFHDKGYKIASDTHVLVVKKEDYPEDYEGKVLNKEGSFVVGRYPDYKSVIPNLDGYVCNKVDFDRLKEYIHNAKAEDKVNKAKPFRCVKIGVSTFELDSFSLLVDFMKEIGNDEIWTKTGRNAYVGKDDNKGVIMPIADDKYDYCFDMNKEKVL